MTLPSGTRRTQAERSSLTREKVIRSATRLLQQRGYGATSVHAIARDAGVSLGAMQHQYPTKAAIMATVLRHHAIKRAHLYRKAVRNQETAASRTESIMQAMWQIVSDGPEFIATIEIELARRSDPELAEATAPVLERMDHFLSRWLSHGSDSLSSEFIKIRRQSTIFLRGLAVEQARGMPRDEIYEAFNDWCVVMYPEFMRLNMLRPL